MDRNNEIIRLAKKAADAWRNTDTYHQAAQIIDMLISALEGEPTLTQPNEWVSVEDRLPRVGGNYICAVQDKNGGKWTIPSEWNLEMKTWFGAFGEIKNKVTHWMPLPAPPDRRLPEGEDK